MQFNPIKGSLFTTDQVRSVMRCWNFNVLLFTSYVSNVVVFSTHHALIQLESKNVEEEDVFELLLSGELQDDVLARASVVAAVIDGNDDDDDDEGWKKE